MTRCSSLTSESSLMDLVLVCVKAIECDSVDKVRLTLVGGVMKMKSGLGEGENIMKGAEADGTVLWDGGGGEGRTLGEMRVGHGDIIAVEEVSGGKDNDKEEGNSTLDATEGKVETGAAAVAAAVSAEVEGDFDCKPPARPVDTSGTHLSGGVDSLAPHFGHSAIPPSPTTPPPDPSIRASDPRVMEQLVAPPPPSISLLESLASLDELLSSRLRQSPLYSPDRDPTLPRVAHTRPSVPRPDPPDASPDVLDLLSAQYSSLPPSDPRPSDARLARLMGLDGTDELSRAVEASHVRVSQSGLSHDSDLARAVEESIKFAASDDRDLVRALEESRIRVGSSGAGGEEGGDLERALELSKLEDSAKAHEPSRDVETSGMAGSANVPSADNSNGNNDSELALALEASRADVSSTGVREDEALKLALEMSLAESEEVAPAISSIADPVVAAAAASSFVPTPAPVLVDPPSSAPDADPDPHAGWIPLRPDTPPQTARTDDPLTQLAIQSSISSTRMTDDELLEEAIRRSLA